MIAWLCRSFDIRLVVIAALLVSDAGHAGRLFSVREASDRAFIGYLLAFCLDAASGIALYDMVNVRKRERRLFALGVFAFASAIATGFSLAYYRDVCPADPLWVSVLMASVAPVLAGMLSVMRAFGHVERIEGEQGEREALLALELEKHRVTEQEKTRSAVLVEREQTKQVRANARAERARSVAEVQAAEIAMSDNKYGDNGREHLPAFSDNGERSYAEFERAMTGGELDISAMTGWQIGQWAGKSPATGRRWKRLAVNGRSMEATVCS